MLVDQGLQACLCKRPVSVCTTRPSDFPWLMLEGLPALPEEPDAEWWNLIQAANLNLGEAASLVCASSSDRKKCF